MWSYVFCNVEAISRRLRAFTLTGHGSRNWAKHSFSHCCSKMVSNRYAQWKLLIVPLRQYIYIYRHMRWTYQELLNRFEENQHWIAFDSLKWPLLEYLQLPNFPRCLFFHNLPVTLGKATNQSFISVRICCRRRKMTWFTPHGMVRKSYCVQMTRLGWFVTFVKRPFRLICEN